MFFTGLGAICFGLVIGWVSHRTLRLPTSPVILSDIATIIEVLGSAAIVALLRNDLFFGLYAIGLILGFFAYFAAALQLYGRQEVLPWQPIKFSLTGRLSRQPANAPVNTTSDAEGDGGQP